VTVARIERSEMREASSWCRMTEVAASSGRDQLEAGLNEAAYCGHALWAFQLGRGAEELLPWLPRVTITAKPVC
jgi:hypothetical protein